METALTTLLQAEEITELDRVCRQQHISPADAVHEAVRFYIERAGDLPTIDYGDELDVA